MRIGIGQGQGRVKGRCCVCPPNKDYGERWG